MSLTLAAAILGHTLLDPSGWRRRQRLALDLSSRAAATAALAARAAALQAEVDALAHSAAAQEHTVRDELGWVRPGELLLHLADPAG